MEPIQILHNPRCSKSRQTLKLLEERGYDVKVTEYLNDPLSTAQLREVYNLLGIDDVLKMMRTQEAEFTEAGLSKQSITPEQAFEAIQSYPRLLERPVVIANGKARIGRPPESVLEIL